MHRQQDIARVLRLPKPNALRVVYWLQRLCEQGFVHDNVQMLRFAQAQSRSIIVTLDWQTKELGCARCGEFAAFFTEDLDPTFKTVLIPSKTQPHDIQKLLLFPVLLYCEACFHGNSWMLPALGYSEPSKPG